MTAKKPSSINCDSTFSGRQLGQEDDVFKFNAWDDVILSDSQVEKAKTIIEAQKSNPVRDNGKILNDCASKWDAFYGNHDDKFFKNRNWLFTEFPELLSSKEAVIFEIGCGVGNTILPILNNESVDNSKLRINGCDFSQYAVSLLKSNPSIIDNNCNIFCHDATDETDFPLPDESVDICIMIFMLSAVHPSKFETVVRKLTKILKPGGIVLFRDYGMFDMTQLRFKSERYIDHNFYSRGDGTCVYYFTTDILRNLFNPLTYNEIQNHEDKRLIVNRLKKLTMHRVWIQAKFQKKGS